MELKSILYFSMKNAYRSNVIDKARGSGCQMSGEIRLDDGFSNGWLCVRSGMGKPLRFYSVIWIAGVVRMGGELHASSGTFYSYYVSF